MTTFLHAHSWLNWVVEDDDEDEVGLKEKPEDTRLNFPYTRSILGLCQSKLFQCFLSPAAPSQNC